MSQFPNQPVTLQQNFPYHFRASPQTAPSSDNIPFDLVIYLAPHSIDEKDKDFTIFMLIPTNDHVSFLTFDYQSNDYLEQTTAWRIDSSVFLFCKYHRPGRAASY